MSRRQTTCPSILRLAMLAAAGLAPACAVSTDEPAPDVAPVDAAHADAAHADASLPQDAPRATPDVPGAPIDAAVPDPPRDAATPDAAPAPAMHVVCDACEARAPRPTQANGDCYYNDYDCKVWPRWNCEQMRMYNRYARACDNYFTLATGDGCSPNVYDSWGNVQAHIDPARNPLGIRFNSGSLITNAATGLARVMAWSMPTDNGVRSGWVDTCVVQQPLLETAFSDQPADPGGETSDWHIVACDPGSDCFNGYLDSAHESLKVVQAGCMADGGESATDYLGRSTTEPAGIATHTMTNEHLVSKIYNLPGHGFGSATNDLYPNDAGITFHRYTSVHSVDVPLYNCARGAALSSLTLEFLYGYVVGHYTTPTGDVTFARRGWIAHPNLSPGVGTTP